MYVKEESISVQIYSFVRNANTPFEYPGCITDLYVNIFWSPFVQIYLVRVWEVIKLLSYKAFFNNETW